MRMFRLLTNFRAKDRAMPLTAQTGCALFSTVFPCALSGPSPKSPDAEALRRIDQNDIPVLFGRAQFIGAARFNSRCTARAFLRPVRPIKSGCAGDRRQARRRPWG